MNSCLAFPSRLGKRISDLIRAIFGNMKKRKKFLYSMEDLFHFHHTPRILPRLNKKNAIFETRRKCLLVSKLIIKQRSTDSFGLFSDPKKCRSHSKSSWTNQIYQNKVVHRVSTNGINFKV